VKAILRAVTPWYPAIAAQAVLVAAGLLGLGYLIADAALRRSDADVLTRWALAFPAAAGFGLLTTLVHVATRGAVLSSPAIVRGVTAAVAVALLAEKLLRARRAPTSGRVVGWTAVAVVALAVAVWGQPLLRLFPLGPPIADLGWHAGWTAHLLNGLATPTAPITGDVPNYYPWGFHGILAFVSHLTPGGGAFRGLGPLHLAQVTGVALGLFALGRQVAGRWLGGVSVALFGSLAAGLGAMAFAFRGLLDRTPQSGGPRLTYNAAFHNLAPPLPLDVGLAFLLSALLLASIGVTRDGRGWFAAAGASLGAAGLVSAESFFVGLGVALLLCLPAGPVPRRWRAAALFGPALALFAVWLVPLAASYVRLGGFVNTTILNAPDPSPFEVVLSWGWMIPLAVWGLVRWAPRARAEAPARVPLALVAAGALLLVASAAVPALLGEGFMVLGRARRYWPLLHLALSVYAGLGAADLVGGLARRPAAIAAAAVALALTLPVPVRVSYRLASQTPRSPAVEGALLGGPDEVVSLVARAGHRSCVVAAPSRLTVPIFTVTGYRLVLYGTGAGRRAGNTARIRWRDVYETIPPESERVRANEQLVNGGANVRTWIETFGVDLIVAEPGAPEAAYAGLGRVGVSSDGERVYRTGDCDG
jgi:hypothetical protein